MNVIKRDGTVQQWNFDKIVSAVTKAFKAVNQLPSDKFLEQLEMEFKPYIKRDNDLTVEEIHDIVRNLFIKKNQFEVVNIGTINTKVPKDSTKDAVMRALNGEKAVGDNIMMFWATYLPKSHRLWQHCTPLKTIGTHHFTDEWR